MPIRPEEPHFTIAALVHAVHLSHTAQCVNEPRNQCTAERVKGNQAGRPRSSSEAEMQRSEQDSECPVCLQHYTRQKRVPRRLLCKHTFCTQCLECLACQDSCNLCMVRCPLCRWTTCVGLPGQGPQDSLWVNSELWDCIPNTDEEEDEITVEDMPTRSTTSIPQTQRNGRPILNIPGVMRKLGFKRPQSVAARPLPWFGPVCRYFSHRSKAATRQGRTVS